jgi:hypothetical protein
MLLYITGPCYINEASEMEMIIKLFLLAYLLAFVLITILTVVWILTAVFTPEWVTKISFGHHVHRRGGQT